MSTKDLDSLLRARAVRELGEEVDTLFRPVHRRAEYVPLVIDDLVMYLQKNRNSTTNVGAVLRYLRDLIVSKEKEDRQNAEVAAFLERVDALGAEVEDLRNSVNN